MKKKVVKKPIKKIEPIFDDDGDFKPCVYCANKVSKTDHQVLLATLNLPDNKADDFSYFHFQCFQDYFNKAVTKKAKNQVSGVQDKMKGIFDNPMVAGLLSKVGGTDKLMKMFNTRLDKDDNEDLSDAKSVDDSMDFFNKKLNEDGKSKGKTGK